MSADRWAVFAGALCDDPVETRGLPVDEPQPEDHWDDMSDAERALATLRSQR